MKSVANVAIHPSQFPENVRRDLIESLRSRQVNHKFHYDSIKQAHKWLALHEAYSPARTDPDCTATYQRSFEAVAARISASKVHLISLGCGGGQKDAQLLKLLHASGKEVFYTPSDVSIPMVLVARQAALNVIPAARCFPLVCDLATAEDLPVVFDQLASEAASTSNAARLVVFFGMLPNFEPNRILPRLSSLVRPQDSLIFSANLAPGLHYASGVQHVLPLYNNALTRDWLLTFLLDLGVERNDGALHFLIEDDPAGTGLKRIAAHFQFTSSRTIYIDDDTLDYASGQTIQLFFSYRHTPSLVRTLFAKQGLPVLQDWISPSEQEGVFLAGRQ